jgi:peptide/nickel transport system substrate-binding protein
MKSRKMTLVALSTASLLALSACGGGSGGGSGSGGTAGTGGGGGTGEGQALTLGIVGELLSWDPAQAHVGHALQPYQAVYDTLLLREPDGTLAPMLATEWGYTDDTNLVINLELRTDVTFSDGAPFSAEAVVANIEHFKADNGRQAAQAAAIESVTAVDEDTVEIKLSRPDPAMEYYLSQALGLMGSPAALGTDGMDRVPVGTGPYTMDTNQSVSGSQSVFTAREDYWNPDLQHWDQIELRVLEDVTSRVNALVSGEVDATLLDAATYQQAEGAGKELLEYGTDWSGLLLMDRDGAINDALADVRVRQAINYAFDREALLQQIGGGFGEVTSQVFGTETTAYDPELEDYYSYDPDKARELLADAGYGDGLTIEMPVLTPGFETIMTFVTQQLADVGITVQQTSVPAADYVPSLAQAKFAAANFNLFQGPSWVATQQLISTDAVYNPFDTTSPEVEALIERQRTGGEDADAAARELNQLVTEEAWFAPWYRPSQLYFFDASVLTVEPQIQMAVPSIYNYAPAS